MVLFVAMDYVYLPPPPSTSYHYPHDGLDWEQQKEHEEKKKIVDSFEKALKNHWFMCMKIKERDCQIHDRWCSVAESTMVTTFVCNYIVEAKTKYPKVNQFDMLNEISIMFPTVDTIDLFQMLNHRKSHKSSDLQWSGHAAMYLKTWKNVDVKKNVMTYAIKSYIETFDDIPGLIKLLGDVEEMSENLRTIDPTGQQNTTNENKLGE